MDLSYKFFYICSQSKKNAMKKIYTSVLVFALLSSTAFAQSKSNAELKPSEKQEKTIIKKSLAEKPVLNVNKDGMVELWSDTFSDPSTW